MPRRSGTQSPYCVNWIVNEGLEIIKGKIGRTVDNKLSRVCKSELAKKFIDLCHATNCLSTFTNNQIHIYYDFLKNVNTDYIAAKTSLMSAFKLSNFGTWVKKPEELTTFELNVQMSND